jgi:hypothetical protein
LRGLTKELLHEVEEFCLAAIQKWPLCPHPYPVLIDIALDSTPSGAASVAQVTTAIEVRDCVPASFPILLAAWLTDYDTFSIATSWQQSWILLEESIGCGDAKCWRSALLS